MGAAKLLATGKFGGVELTRIKKNIMCVQSFFFFDTFSFKMVQIFLPIVVYTQWIFNYIQQWNNVGKIAIEKQSTELAVTNPVSNNREWEIVFFIKFSAFTFSISI